MLLAEVFIEMEQLEYKIYQLEKYLRKVACEDADLTNTATSKLLDLIDKHRSHLIIINKTVNSVVIDVGGSRVSLADANLIAEALKRKIDLLNSLIENTSVLDVFDLMEQRDKNLKEYLMLANQISATEWGTEID